MFDCLLLNAQCFIEGELVYTDIALENGKIKKLGVLKNEKATEVYDCKDMTIIPGVIDTQVHFREPGNTHKEDLASGSRAAALGGVTSFFEMPNTNPSTTTKEAMEKKLAIASEKSVVNYAFFIGATENNIEEIKSCQGMSGLCGVKIFLGSSTGSLLLNDEKVILELFKNIPMMFSIHSEDEEIMKKNFSKLPTTPPVHLHSSWRSPESALSSTKKIIALAHKANKKIHVLHISTKEEVDFLIENKKVCTFEITPQHLHLHAPDCYERLGSFSQMNPPIREMEHQKRLWEAVANNEVAILGSDHAPHTVEEKKQPYPTSPSGIPGAQTIFPLMLNACMENKISLNQLVNYFVKNPVEVFKIKNKGQIKKGFDGDLTIFSNRDFTIKNEDQASKCGWTPFDGKRLKGRVEMTVVGGKVVMRDNKIITREELSSSAVEFHH